MKKRILVIDDDDMMRGAVAATLRSSEYEVFQSADGLDGLEQARSFLPDLIVCDINMPKVDGFELLEQLRKSDLLSTIPFVFLSGQSDKSDIRKGMMLGAEDYLTKPVVANELLRVVELRLKKKESLENQMQSKLDELRKSISLSLPHEFRTPLTGILGFAEMLKEVEQPSLDEIRYIASRIHSSAKRLHHLLENILMAADLDALATDGDRLKAFQNSATAIGIVLTQVVESLAGEWRRKDDVRISVQDTRVKTHEPHLAKIIEELVSNAMKFSEQGKQIMVSSSVEGNFAAIVVQDNGKGMTPDQISRIGAYVQFDRSRNEQQGSGLGLNIVKKIVRLYNGSLSIESLPAGGTTVNLKLPLAV